MTHVVITAEVYCTRGDGNPIYRIYVNDDLLTERNWTWPAYETYIRENIEVEVDAGTHQLNLVDCNPEPVFYLKNVTVNGAANNGGMFTV